MNGANLMRLAFLSASRPSCTSPRLSDANLLSRISKSEIKNKIRARAIAMQTKNLSEIRFFSAPETTSAQSSDVFRRSFAISSTRFVLIFLLRATEIRPEKLNLPARNRVLDLPRILRFARQESEIEPKTENASGDTKHEIARRHENDWIRRAQNGDLDAFDQLVALHQNKIFNLCRWNLGNDDDAADAAQDVFVRAWKFIGKFRNDSALSTWLHRIAINVISDAATRRKRAPMPLSNLRDEEEDAPLEIADSADQPQDSALRNARRRSVQNALAQLPENQRAVLVLFDVQGHSYEDLAAILELPLGTVKSRLSRARLALRAQLEACRELWDE